MARSSLMRTVEICTLAIGNLRHDLLAGAPGAQPCVSVHALFNATTGEATVFVGGHLDRRLLFEAEQFNDLRSNWSLGESCREAVSFDDRRVERETKRAGGTASKGREGGLQERRHDLV